MTESYEYKISPPLIHKPIRADWNELSRLLKHYPLPSDFQYSYGTAGFRYDHAILPPVMIRMGILSALRSRSLKGGQSVGLMVTASHNPENDNGIKLCDADGGMLHSSWEGKATELANTKDPLSFLKMDEEDPIVVHVGRDTRNHSRFLAQLVIRTVVAMGGTCIDHGCVTTPQLHYFVLRSNWHHVPNTLICGGSGGGFEKEYLEGMVASYASLLQTDTRENTKKQRTLLVDCACGVGGAKILFLKKILQYYDQNGTAIFEIKKTKTDGPRSPFVQLFPINLPNDGPLNEKCGAEFVQKQRIFPRVYSDLSSNEERDLDFSFVASLDGDADRIVFHYKDTNGKLGLLDGDKISVLVSGFLQEELTALGSVVPYAKKIKCGVVQTAYANGASSNFLKKHVKTDVAIAKTGVKFVHSVAHEKFDVGIYFEANGHGTVLFSRNFYQLMADAEQVLLSSSPLNRATIAWQRLRLLPRLINQAVGDALSDLFLVDAILFLRGWDLVEWNRLYSDLPSRQCKVRVKDRTTIVTNDNESQVIEPSFLQTALDSAMDAIAKSGDSIQPSAPPRTFVRPSGTENVVRVYAEADTQTKADALASEAAALVFRICDGVGDCPNFIKSKV